MLPELQLYFIRISYGSVVTGFLPNCASMAWTVSCSKARAKSAQRAVPKAAAAFSFAQRQNRKLQKVNCIWHTADRKGWILAFSMYRFRNFFSVQGFLLHLLFNEMIDGEPKNDEKKAEHLDFHSETVMHWEMERLPNGYSMMLKHWSCHITVTAKMPDWPNQHRGQSFCFWWFDPPVMQKRNSNKLNVKSQGATKTWNKTSVIDFYHWVNLSGLFFKRVVPRSKGLGSFWKWHLLEELGDIPRCWWRGLG